MIITTSMGSMGCRITSSLTFQLSMPRNLNRTVSYVSGWNWTILDFPKSRIKWFSLLSYLQLFFRSVGCIVWFGRHVWPMSTFYWCSKMWMEPGSWKNLVGKPCWQCKETFGKTSPLNNIHFWWSDLSTTFLLTSLKDSEICLNLQRNDDTSSKQKPMK